jgi:hypothetical protein
MVIRAPDGVIVRFCGDVIGNDSGISHAGPRLDTSVLGEADAEDTILIDFEELPFGVDCGVWLCKRKDVAFVGSECRVLVFIVVLLL